MNWCCVERVHSHGLNCLAPVMTIMHGGSMDKRKSWTL